MSILALYAACATIRDHWELAARERRALESQEDRIVLLDEFLARLQPKQFDYHTIQHGLWNARLDFATRLSCALMDNKIPMWSLPHNEVPHFLPKVSIRKIWDFETRAERAQIYKDTYGFVPNMRNAADMLIDTLERRSPGNTAPCFRFSDLMFYACQSIGDSRLRTYQVISTMLGKNRDLGALFAGMRQLKDFRAQLAEPAARPIPQAA